MRSGLISITSAFFITLIGCSKEHPVEPADLVFSGGQIFTSDPLKPAASALAVRGDTIVYVGDSAGLAPFIDNETQLISIGDGLLIPGLMDSHTHVFNGSFADVEIGRASCRERV